MISNGSDEAPARLDFDVFLKHFEKNGFYCTRCNRPISHIGVCKDCAIVVRMLEQRELHDSLIENIPKHYRWAVFGSPLLEERITGGRSKVDAARYATSRIAENKDLVSVIAGQSGAGKTSLGCAMIRELALQFGFMANVVTAIELSTAREESSLGQTPQCIDISRRSKILLIDDVGDEEKHYEVKSTIKHRHDHELITIMTTFLDPEEMSREYGDGASRRAFEYTRINLACI